MDLYSNESIFQVLFVTLVLGAGCALTVGLYLAMTHFGPRLGLAL